MNVVKMVFRRHWPTPTEWCGLLLMAFTAPCVAGLIHSIVVVNQQYQIYNAEFGWPFYRMSGSKMPWFDTIGAFTSLCLVKMVPTFILLLPFNLTRPNRLVLWGLFVAVWTWLSFQMEVAIK